MVHYCSNIIKPNPISMKLFLCRWWTLGKKTFVPQVSDWALIISTTMALSLSSLRHFVDQTLDRFDICDPAI